MSTVMRATAGLLALGLVATACSGPSGEPGEHGQGWYSTDLIGGDGDWPVVAWGASFQITIETDAPCGEDPEGDDDDSAEPRDGEPLSLYVTSSDEQVVAIRAVEQEWIEDSDWADD